MIPVGLLVGGILTDYVFEPFMANGSNTLSFILGSGTGYRCGYIADYINDPIIFSVEKEIFF